MSNNYPLTIYYDSSCPLCDQEMSRLKQRDQYDNLHLIDCSAPDFIPPHGAPDVASMMQLLHAQTSDGQWVIGVPAFQLAYAGAGFGFVSNWLERPLISRMMHRLYPLIARNRYLIPGWVAGVWFNYLAISANRRSRACANGQCKI